MTSLHLLLVAAAVVIIALLSGYAWHLTRKVKQQEIQQQKEEAEAELQLRKYQQELVKDVQFVARSVIQQQCEITEGVLRIQYLVNGLDPDVWNQPELKQVREHYFATCDMPILDAYQALTPKQQFKLDKERHKLEQDNKEAIEAELTWLAAHSFPSVTLLQ